MKTTRNTPELVKVDAIVDNTPCPVCDAQNGQFCIVDNELIFDSTHNARAVTYRKHYAGSK